MVVPDLRLPCILLILQLEQLGSEKAGRPRLPRCGSGKALRFPKRQADVCPCRQEDFVE